MLTLALTSMVIGGNILPVAFSGIDELGFHGLVLTTFLRTTALSAPGLLVMLPAVITLSWLVVQFIG